MSWRVLVLILIEWILVGLCQDPESTTPTIDTSSLTPAFNVTEFPTLYCRSMGLTGLMVNPSDATCKTYLRCLPQYTGGVNVGVVGMIYRCPGITFFDDTLKQCGLNNTCAVI